MLIHKLDIVIETPKGQSRSKIGADGKRWTGPPMPCAYGEIKGHRAADGDRVDAYIGPDKDSSRVWVVDQVKADTGKYDEAKVLIGFKSKAEALRCYEDSFGDGKAKDRLGPVAEMGIDQFKSWLASGGAKKPLGGKAPMPKINPLDLARKYATGGRVGYAEGGAPLEAGEYMPERAMRRLTKKMMYDAAPTEEELAALKMHEARQERATEDSARTGFETMAEFTGVPSVIRGVENIKGGIDEGDALRGFKGAGEAALGVLPGLGVAGRGLKALEPAYRTFMSTAPRAIGTTLGGMAASVPFDAREAQAGTAEKVSKMLASNPDVKRLRDQILRLDQDQLAAEQRQIALGTTAIPNMNKKSADEARARGDAAIATQLKSIEAKRTKLQDDLAKAEAAATESAMDQLSFRERNPGAAQTMMLGGLGLAGLAGFGKGWGKAASDSKLAGRINNDAKRLDASFANEAPIAETAAAQDVLRRRLSRWDNEHNLGQTGTSGVANAAKGAFIGADASAAPEIIDYISNDPGHPNRERAREEFGRATYFAERAVPAMLGVTASTVGSMAGKGLRGAMGAKPDMEVARELAARGEKPGLFQSRFNDRLGIDSSSPSKESIGRIERYRGEAASPGEGGKLLEIPSAHPPRALEPQSSPRALSSSEASPLPTIPGTEIPLPPGWRLDKNGVVYSGHNGQKISKKHYTPKEEKSATRSKAKSVDEDSTPEKASGGRISSAISLAKAYASGGRVHVGPVIGETGGRADKLPVDVPAGAYVIPADCVGSVGDAGGNTLAGMKILQKHFGKPVARASGGAVPILISDGEFVVSPEQVEKIGGGNLERGHKILDSMIKGIRENHIKTLSSLPGPSK